MCGAENPLAPAQLRWINVLDRLWFFCNSNEHSNRSINIGLAYAYRHKELDALTAANALRLSDLRISSGPGRDKAPGGAVLIPATLVAAAAGPQTDATICAPSVVDASVGDVAQPLADDSGLTDGSINLDAGMVLPLGGVVVARSGARSRADATRVAAPRAAGVGSAGANAAGPSGTAVPSSVPVLRVGPHTRPSICTSVAPLLLVATKEPDFAGVVTQLSSLGRAPLSKDASLLGATCHDFETAGQADPAAVAPHDGMPVAPRIAAPAAASADGDPGNPSAELDHEDEAQNDAGLSGKGDLESLHVEMERLLQKEKVIEAVASRASRLAVRRLARPETEPKQSSQPSCSYSAFMKPTLQTLGTETSPSPLALQPQDALMPRRMGADAPAWAPGPDPRTLLHLCPPRRPALQPAATGNPKTPALPGGPVVLSKDRGRGTKRARGGGTPAVAAADTALPPAHAAYHVRSARGTAAVPAADTTLPFGGAADVARGGIGPHADAAAELSLPPSDTTDSDRGGGGPPVDAVAGMSMPPCDAADRASGGGGLPAVADPGAALAPGHATDRASGGGGPPVDAADKMSLPPEDADDGARGGGSPPAVAADGTSLLPGYAAGRTAAGSGFSLDESARSALADDKNLISNCVTSLFAVSPTFQEFLAAGGGDSMDEASFLPSNSDDN